MSDEASIFLVCLRLLILVGLIAYMVHLGRGLGDQFHVARLVALVQCAIAIVPLVSDMLFGVPTFYTFRHVRTVLADETTEIIYLLWILPACWMIAFFGTRRHSKRQQRFALRQTQAFLIPLLAVIAFLPVILLIVEPANRQALEYAVVTNGHDVGVELTHLYTSTHIALLAAAGLELLTARGLLTQLSSGTAAACTIWLNGKRNIVAVAMFLFLLVLRLKYRKGLPTLALLAVFLGGCYTAYSTWYQNSFRQTILIDEVRQREMVRMDYGRDTDIKMAIFSMLHPDVPILDFPGQSLLFDALVFVPRAWWPDKPLPYYNYITPVALGISDRNLKWGVTTSWLGEAIANLNWFGFVVGPIFLALLCRIGDVPDDMLISILTTLICLLFLTIHLAGFVPLLGLWVALLVRRALTHKTGRRRGFIPAMPEGSKASL